jgi:hypothetical protein
MYKTLVLIFGSCAGIPLLAQVEPATADRDTKFPITITSKDGDFDQLIFRACNQIPDDRAALNIFLWAYQTRIKFDKDFDDNLKLRPNAEMKFVDPYSGRLEAHPEGFIFQIKHYPELEKQK